MHDVISTFIGEYSATPPKKKKRNNEEQQIQDAIAKHLLKDGWIVVRLNSGFIATGRTPFRSYLLYGLGISAGMPDLLAFKENRTRFLEVKTAKGRLSQSQKKVKEYFAKHNLEYEVVRGVEDL